MKSITIQLDDAIAMELQRLADERGQSLEALVVELIAAAAQKSAGNEQGASSEVERLVIPARVSGRRTLRDEIYRR